VSELRDWELMTQPCEQAHGLLKNGSLRSQPGPRGFQHRQRDSSGGGYGLRHDFAGIGRTLRLSGRAHRSPSADFDAIGAKHSI
jgi:hypothetical protein